MPSGVGFAEDDLAGRQANHEGSDPAIIAGEDGDGVTAGLQELGDIGLGGFGPLIGLTGGLAIDPDLDVVVRGRLQLLYRCGVRYLWRPRNLLINKA